MFDVLLVLILLIQEHLVPPVLPMSVQGSKIGLVLLFWDIILLNSPWCLVLIQMAML